MDNNNEILNQNLIKNKDYPRGTPKTIHYEYKIEPLINSSTKKIFHKTLDSEDPLYNVPLNNYESSITQFAHEPFFLEDFDDFNDSIGRPLIKKSPYNITVASSLEDNNLDELKRLLKVQVSSPLSFNFYQSINDTPSIDSSHTNITINSQITDPEFCVICSDVASGKHYGVMACEGCKGFFKRTIRKNLHYICREQNRCPITEKLRNRCQSCRFNKCLEKGMKIKAVQNNRIDKLKSSRSSTYNVNNPVSPITADNVLQNEMQFFCVDNLFYNQLQIIEVENSKDFCTIVNNQLFNLVMWAKAVPGFSFLERSDQMILLNKSWVEILNLTFSFFSLSEFEIGSIKMDENHRLRLSAASELGIHNLLIRMFRELIGTLKTLEIDQMEIACLKAIVLFDSNYNNLKNAELIKQFRFRIFDILKKYVSEKYPKQPSRIYKLLLKLPSVRGLTTCFIEKMKLILYGNSSNDNIECCPCTEICDNDNQSDQDLLYPLLSELMKQKIIHNYSLVN